MTSPSAPRWPRSSGRRCSSSGAGTSAASCTTATDTYGFFGVVIVLLSWIYLGAQLFLLAAEINVVSATGFWPRSITQPPLTAADKGCLRAPGTDGGPSA